VIVSANRHGHWNYNRRQHFLISRVIVADVRDCFWRPGAHPRIRYDTQGNANTNINTNVNVQRVVVPYNFKRAILCDGDYPHQSTPILKLPSNIHRVVIGVNVFDHCVGPHVTRAPEHSQAFNRRAKLYQALYTPRPRNNVIAPAPLDGAIPVPLVDNTIIKLTFNSLKHHKPLAKLLVLAKRKQAKHEFHQQQAMANKLYSQLWTALDAGQTKTIQVTELIHHVKQSLLNATTATTTTLRLHDSDLYVCLNALLKMHHKLFQVVHGEEGDAVGASVSHRHRTNRIINGYDQIRLVNYNDNVHANLITATS
jgi:hypothetical protein